MRGDKVQCQDMSVVVFEKMTVHSSDADIVTDGVMTGGRSAHI